MVSTDEESDAVGDTEKTPLTLLYCAILYCIVLPCTVHFGFADTNDSNQPSKCGSFVFHGRNFYFKNESLPFQSRVLILQIMETGTYSVGHVCCFSVLTDFDMKMNLEHTDEMHGKGYVSL